MAKKKFEIQFETTGYGTAIVEAETAEEAIDLFIITPEDYADWRTTEPDYINADISDVVEVGD